VTSARGNGVKALRKFCLKHEGLAEFLKSASARQSEDPGTHEDSTEIQGLVEDGGVDKRIAIEFGRLLETAGFANFIVGRHGRPTRIEWLWSLKEIVDELFQAETVDLTRSVSPTTSSSASQPRDETLTIAEAKRLLARTLGVLESAIEITVRY
jgi:hypothetical protein